MQTQFLRQPTYVGFLAEVMFGELGSILASQEGQV